MNVDPNTGLFWLYRRLADIALGVTNNETIDDELFDAVYDYIQANKDDAGLIATHTLTNDERHIVIQLHLEVAE